MRIDSASPATFWVNHFRIVACAASTWSSVAVSPVPIAYEPVWAIGTGETATLDQVDAAHATIRKWLTQKVAGEAESIRILYGGSVKPDNAGDLMSLDSVDGLLVGGASLAPESFLPIIEYDSK